MMDTIKRKDSEKEANVLRHRRGICCLDIKVNSLMTFLVSTLTMVSMVNMISASTSTTARLSLLCDNYATVSVSSDGGQTFIEHGHESEALCLELHGLSTTDTVVRVSCRDEGWWTGFVATLKFDEREYSTKMTIDGDQGPWSINYDLSTLDDSVSLIQQSLESHPFVTQERYPLIVDYLESEAQMIWNSDFYLGALSNVMVFEFAFNDIPEEVSGQSNEQSNGQSNGQGTGSPVSCAPTIAHRIVHWFPTESPSDSPTESPTEPPSESPTESPTESPKDSPTNSPVAQLTVSPEGSSTKSSIGSLTNSSTGSSTASPLSTGTTAQNTSFSARFWDSIENLEFLHGILFVLGICAVCCVGALFLRFVLKSRGHQLQGHGSRRQRILRSVDHGAIAGVRHEDIGEYVASNPGPGPGIIGLRHLGGPRKIARKLLLRVQEDHSQDESCQQPQRRRKEVVIRMRKKDIADLLGQGL